MLYKGLDSLQKHLPKEAVLRESLAPHLLLQNIQIPSVAPSLPRAKQIRPCTETCGGLSRASAQFLQSTSWFLPYLGFFQLRFDVGQLKLGFLQF